MKLRKSISALAFILTWISCLWSQNGDLKPQPVRQIIDEIRTQVHGMRIWWTGQNGWLIKADTVLMATDLCLESDERLYTAPVSADQLAAELDISFITHEHGDHFERETSKILALKSRCIFVMPQNCLQIALDLGIPRDRIIVAVPKHPFEIGMIKVHPLRAIHGNPRFAVFEEANLEDCGYLITVNGKNILQPGDTVLLEDHLFLKHVEVLFFSPTEHNMYIQPAVILINELEPDYILPQHGSTFRVTPENRFWTTSYSYEVKMMLGKDLQKRYRIMEQGESIEIK
jgi:L-ascorbate 6-phosphate lactonase